ncbi:uncharacterized protein PRCAT00004156001 [Priceomyces carsonii]|uniref:uncharacterized protein n=1 Tax=Priceomyces carsonii TaxID=28549 RepID=UPI002ED9440D|nr:unnamed protein product [Priceomyces carsonii]
MQVSGTAGTSGTVTPAQTNKESPLTDIGTSPPQFELPVQNRELKMETPNELSDDGSTLSQKQVASLPSTTEPVESSENNANTGSLNDNKLTEKTSKGIYDDHHDDLGNNSIEKTKDGNISVENLSNTSEDVHNHEGSQEKEFYESSELSDLADDDSEAETDRMGFLDEDGHSDKGLDLQALSNLTEIARLKEIDSEDDEDYEHQESEKNESGDLAKPEPEPTDNELEINPKDNEVAKNEIENDINLIKEELERPLAAKRTAEPNTDVKRHKLDDEVDKNDRASGVGEEEDDEKEDEEEEENENNKSGLEHTSTEDVDLTEQRKLAVEELISIEGAFAQLRDKLYKDKLTLLEHELQLCLEGSHPELSKIYHKVNEFYQTSIELANSNLNYNLKCIDRETVATRTAIHQDFMTRLMDSKNEMISSTTSLWYKINKERNQLDQLVPEYNFTAIPHVPSYAVTSRSGFNPNGISVEGNAESYPNGVIEDAVPLSKKAIKYNTLVELVQNRNNTNHELGILNGLIQFDGFPAAVGSSLLRSDNGPSYELLLKRAADDEIKEDLQAMGILS